jgi:ribosome-associated protein
VDLGEPVTAMDGMDGVSIPEDELVFRTSRSSGPGGQNVNKLNTRVTLLFDVAGSPSLAPEQKQQILHRLSNRVDRSGVLHVTSQQHRSQEANRRAAVERLQQLVQEALKPRPVRKKTKTPAAARERRLREKKRQSDRKQQRAGRDWAQE